ncbi:helix-turn-helix domain-containing protein [Laspinema olomoucense]|uniref:helix-turn-helix domain-containing protein n=1 Tax=Laspinema olomoucense TaxID=3231600 RepID=UPI0021BB7509|nr:helix-turn-helix transcriptional regulator [Laspinema sp. D3d]MCT7976070.1 helix-turn-helix domain-containing protein [Laspinema sp. D3d]
MFIHEAFNETLKRYHISGRALAEAADVSQSMVSQFRHGKKGVTDEMLDNLLLAMQQIAPGSRSYFCSLVAGESLGSLGVKQVIEGISEEEIPQLLVAIAYRWKNSEGGKMAAEFMTL